MDLKTSVHFPTIIYQCQKPEWVSTTLEKCQPHFDLKKSKEPELKKIFPVYQTDSIHHDSELAYLTKFIVETAMGILDGQGYDLSHHELFFEDMWAQEVYTYGHHFPHVHGNSQISGFFFLECPVDGIYPLFYDPRHGKAMTDLPEKNRDDITVATYECNYKPIPGTFMFFNSWLPHGFQLNGSEHPSKFIHFNVSARRKYEK
jgi:uncharacterized protein (TIGR02466 family)